MNKNYYAWGIGILMVLILGYLLINNQPSVSAQGNSVLKVQPDEISIYVNIETRNASLADAQKDNALISDKVTNALIGVGVSKDNIRLAGYNNYPWQEWTGSTYTDHGFVVSQQLIVSVKEYAEVSKIVNVVTSNSALVQSIQFELSQEKQNEYKAQTLKSASEDAKKKAASIAEGQGRNLGRLVKVSSSEFSYYPMQYYAMKEGVSASSANDEARIAASNIAPSDIEVSSSVSVEYRLGLL